MALSANTVWEVRTTGSNTNGGGFVTGASGTDHSQQDAAQYAVTDAVTDGTTTITSATANFGTDVVGNILYIQGGTGSITAGWYQITARNSSTSITVDRSTGLTTGTGATLNIGGAVASLVTLDGGVLVSGNKVYIKAGTYTHSTAIWFGDNVGNASDIEIIGYNTTRTDSPTGANRPVLKATAAINLLSIDHNLKTCVSHIIFDGDSVGLIGVRFIAYSSYNFALCHNCLAKNWVTGGFTGSHFVHCEAHNNGYGFGLYTNQVNCHECYAHDNTGDGFSQTSGGTYNHCISESNGGKGFYNYGNSSFASFTNCVAYNNTGIGFDSSGGSVKHHMANCISYSNGSYGADGWFSYKHCAFGSNTSGAVNGTRYDLGGNVTLTANPFVDAPNGNFALNSIAGGGAACRAAGFPGTFPGGLTIGYIDIGAAQHPDKPESSPHSIFDSVIRGVDF